MPGSFKFKSSFDRARFQAEVLAAWRSRKYDNGIEDYLRERGLRYVIEAPADMTQDEVARQIRATLHPEFGVEPLFEDFPGNPVPEDLRHFYLATLRGVLPEDLTQSPYEGAYALLAESRLLSAEPDLPYQNYLGTAAAGRPPTSLSPPVPSLTDLAWSLRNTRAERAWRLFPSTGPTNGMGVSIAHLDTGWTDHVDMDQANFDHARAMDYIQWGGTARDVLGYIGNPGHGTKTASVIMSQGDVTPAWPPGTVAPGQITGVARFATYVPVRCIRSVVVIFNGDVARAVRYATAHDCHVTSMSLGGRPLRALHRALRDTVKNDLLVVCAAGNNVGVVVWPARYPEAMAIAANNISDGHWSGSSSGPRVDISAPGEDVWHAEPDPIGVAIFKGGGTSYATANMAGVAALWLSFHGRAFLRAVALKKGLPLQELFRAEVWASARVPAGWPVHQYGAGIVDAERLLLSKPAAATITAAVLPTPRAQHYATDVASLLCEDDPRRGFELLVMLFRAEPPEVYVMLDLFGHELANVLLDYPEILARLREAAKASPSEASLLYVRSELEQKVSQTLRDVLAP